MFPPKGNSYHLELPLKRQFNWPVFITLVVLYFSGNLAGIPLLLKTGIALEPIWYWGVVTAISALVIAVSLLLANRNGLGAPFLEGRLSRKDSRLWLRSGLKHCLVILVLSLPISLLVNRRINPATYPFGWELLLASFKAGVVEEIASRLFLVSLITWIGGLFRRDNEGRPTPEVYWAAILIAGLLFGWAHVDSMRTNPEAVFTDKALVMVLNSGLGVYFGWLYWRLGLEWAIFAHFAYDVFTSMIAIPLFLLI
jgi:hypothetical protein